MTPIEYLIKTKKNLGISKGKTIFVVSQLRKFHFLESKK